MQIHKCCGLDLRDVGKNHVIGGKHGGSFMALWGKEKMSYKLWCGRCWDLVISATIFLHWFGSQGLTLHRVIDSSYIEICMLSV